MTGKKHPEIDGLRRMLGDCANECRDLRSVNLQVNTMRVNAHKAMTAERESLIARIHRIDSWLTLLGFDFPAQMKKENQ